MIRKEVECQQIFTCAHLRKPAGDVRVGKLIGRSDLNVSLYLDHSETHLCSFSLPLYLILPALFSFKTEESY